jgi:hypothetical protein
MHQMMHARHHVNVSSTDFWQFHFFFIVQLAAFRAGVEDVMSVAALSPFSELELQVYSRVTVKRDPYSCQKRPALAL